MTYYNEQREEESGHWELNVKYTNIKPFESCKVISVINGEFVILDFSTNNGGEFYWWHPDSGVMEKVNTKKLMNY